MTTRQLFVVIFFLALVVMPLRETTDPDLGWHLATGEYVLTQGIPTSDPFSFTRFGEFWTAHEWLTDVIMALIVRAVGLPGLIVFYAGVIALTFGLVYARSDGQPYLAAFVVLLAALVSGITWGARPQMINLLGMAFFTWVIEGVRVKQLRWRALWLLPLGSALWANLHSGYLVGVVLVAVYAVGEVLTLLTPGLFGRDDGRALGWPGVKWLGGTAVACLLAAAANPQGVFLWIYPFFTLGSGAMQTYIQEWQSPNFQFFPFWPFAGLLGLGVLTWLVSGRKPTWTDLLLFGGTGLAGLWSARHVSLFAVVAAPVVLRALTPWLRNVLASTPLRPLVYPEAAPSTTPLLKGVNIVVFVVLVGLGGLQLVNVVQRNEAAMARVFPVAAVDYLIDSGLADQPGWNSYNWGGYLIWRGIPVFVDGRADVYYDEFLLYYLQTFQAQPGWEIPLNDYSVGWVLTETGNPLATVLTLSPAWESAYSDGQADIFVRVNEYGE